jgi:hypothetical protein
MLDEDALLVYCVEKDLTIMGWIHVSFDQLFVCRSIRMLPCPLFSNADASISRLLHVFC